MYNNFGHIHDVRWRPITLRRITRVYAGGGEFIPGGAIGLVDNTAEITTFRFAGRRLGRVSNGTHLFDKNASIYIYTYIMSAICIYTCTYTIRSGDPDRRCGIDVHPTRRDGAACLDARNVGKSDNENRRSVSRFRTGSDDYPSRYTEPIIKEMSTGTFVEDERAHLCACNMHTMSGVVAVYSYLGHRL